MKCPYQTIVTHQPEYRSGYIKHFAQDITEFSDCMQNECPFYYETVEHKKVKHCKRAENEEEQIPDWMYSIFDKDKIKAKKEQWTKEAEEAGMTLTDKEQETCEDALFPTAEPVGFEEAKKLIYQEWKNKVAEDNPNQRLLVAYQIAMKALEQEPCEDAISRQAVLNKIKEVCFSREWKQFRVDYGSNGQRDLLIEYIEQLPSVTPNDDIEAILEHLWNDTADEESEE